MTFEGDIEFGPYDKAERKARQAFEFYEDGKISQALLVMEDALQINPTNSRWHFNKALILDTINNLSESSIKTFFFKIKDQSILTSLFFN